jgi:hypothetical protein
MVLQNIESNTIDLLKQKNKMLRSCEDHENFIEYDKDAFLRVQRKKIGKCLVRYFIDELHKYLEEKYLNIIVEYNVAIEKDILNIRNNKDRMIREINENMK